MAVQFYRGQLAGRARSSRSDAPLAPTWHERRAMLPRRLQAPHLEGQPSIPPHAGALNVALRDVLARELGYWWS